MSVKKFAWKERAVSPVIGVMLMLVATVVIAAVVQSYAGGLATSTPKAPQASFDVKIKNTGYWESSGIFIRCLSTDEPIPSKDVKIVTIHTNRTTGNTTVTEVIPGRENVNFTAIWAPRPGFWTAFGHRNYTAPLGVTENSSYVYYYADVTPDILFGNYTIKAGTYMTAHPAPAIYGDARANATPYGYPPLTDCWNNINASTWYCVYGINCRGNTTDNYTDNYATGVNQGCFNGTDSAMAMIKSWPYVSPGDIVTVQIVHIPSGKVIFSKDVVVEG